ncbi:MAG: hypothetical protein AAGA58_07455 [Verrucomicrobiota bacterium]
MRFLIAFFVVVFALFPILGIAQGSTKVGAWSKEAHMQWWKDHPDASQWPAEREAIHAQLLEIHRKLGTSKAFANRHFVPWVRHLEWLSLFPDAPEAGSFFADVNAAETFSAVALSDGLESRFLESLSPHDDRTKAAEILCRLFAADAEATREYAALAIAFALVFDQPFPTGWPHSFVDKADVLHDETPVEERFAFFVNSAREGRLELDPKRLGPQELKFVVDTPVPLEELAHVQRIKIRSTRALEDLFMMIPYAQTRLSGSDYVWPHGPYRVFTIQNKGGLCVDQAYYTSHTAKAKGIPSIIFLGQGVSGAHAWLGYLQTYGDWAFDLAKFRSERYPVGRAYDPQTWRKLTDSECEFLNRNDVSEATRAKVSALLGWAALNPGEDFTRDLYVLARREAPTFVWAWDAEAEFLAASKANAEVRMDFWSDWTKAFSRQKDLAFRGQKRVLALLDESGKTEQFEEAIDQLMRENRSKRYDLVIDVAAEQVMVKIEEAKWEEAHESFLKSMVRLRSKAGGELFYRLVEPYVTRCLEADRVEFAEKAIDQAAKSFEAIRGSILDRDLSELATLVRAKSRG